MSNTELKNVNRLAAIENAAEVTKHNADRPLLAGCGCGCNVIDHADSQVRAGQCVESAEEPLLAGCIDGTVGLKNQTR